ncbi:MAG: sporulation integral membrane protein YlbJ [Clostridium sp.]
MISIFVLAILIFFLLCYLLKKFNVNNSILICFFITIFSILFFLNIQTSLDGIKKGFYLCFNSIIPSIFSFSVICNLLIAYDGISIYSKLLGPLICRPLRLNLNCSFILISSFLCGYPLGSKYATEAYESGSISKDEYFRVLSLASNASPIFIIGVLGSSMLGNIKLGYILLLSSFLSILFLSFFIKPSKTSLPKPSSIQKKASPKFGFALQFAIENGVKTTLNVCGYVVLFSLVLSILKNISFLTTFCFSIDQLFSLPKNLFYSIFLGTFEITNGCNLISSINFSIHLKLSIISFFICFGGFSIIFQTSSFFSKTVPLKRYIFFKFFQGILGFISTFLISNLFFRNMQTTTPIHSPFPLFTYIFFTLSILIIIFLISKGKKVR